MATDAARLTREGRAALLHGIYVILNDDERTLELARDVLEAGVRIVQYRAKRGIVPERLRALRALTEKRAALLILNDDWRAADAFDCDGVHLGPDDAGFDGVAAVRAALGELLIGLSCGTVSEARAAAGADYIGAGAIYPTASKADAGEPIGIEGLRAIAAATNLPIAAIGGITGAAIAELRSNGAAMAAVVSAISNANDPSAAAAELVDAWNR